MPMNGVENLPSPGLATGGAGNGNGGNINGGAETRATGGGSGVSGQLPPPPQVPVLQHRPQRMERVGTVAHAEGRGAPVEGGPPLLVDRAILVVLLALLALVVRKFA